MDIQKLVRPNIRSLSAYEAKEIPCRVKLDANESPYGFKKALKAIADVETNRYPDPEARTLKRFISRYLGVKPDCVLQGNGSDELIYYLITTFGGPVLYPIPTFSMYGIIAQALGEKQIEIPLDNEFDLSLKDILKKIKKERPKLIFLSSPNNPTGNCYSSDRILKIIDLTSSLVTRHSSLVVVDEAYQPFSSKKGFLPLLKDYKNLLIMRTLSKIGLAGLRVGFLIADREIINEVNKVRLPFNCNSLSQAIAAEVLKDRKTLRAQINAIVSEREKLSSEMEKIRGVRPYPSEANFILFRVNDSDRIHKRLLQKGVLVRNMKGVADGCLRVTVGTTEENRIFLNAMKKVVNLAGANK
ncbi:MAG: histidinol-phosphate transaminase [Nitrospirae bacterium RBG_13_43_8]|nr:MAG: histidinol-phosphate transaminase [Nitrospirae bacterium RBG_13_43_8]